MTELFQESEPRIVDKLPERASVEVVHGQDRKEEEKSVKKRM